MKNTIAAILCMLMVVLSGSAQESGLIHSVDVINGLADNCVKGILRDQFGFMWFATPNGLNRYDGYRFAKYSTIPLGNENDDIEAIYNDGSGVIWLIVTDHIYAYDYRSDKIHNDAYKRLAEIGIKEKPTLLKTDDQKNLWVTTKRHIFYYDFQRKRLYTIRNQTGTAILDVTARDDVAYALASNGEFYQTDLHAGRLRREGHVGLSSYSNWHYIYLDSRGRLWFYSAHSPINDLYCYDTQQHRGMAPNVMTKLKNTILTSLTDDGKGNIWIGTENEGITIYDGKGEVKSILKGSHVNTLYLDTQNTMWVGTGKQGVIWQELSEPLFVNTYFDGLEDVSTITEDRQGGLWIGFDGGGLVRKDPSGNDMLFTKQNGRLPSNLITCSTADTHGRFWTGTFGSGVLQWDGRGRFVKYPLRDAKGKEILYVRCMTATPDGSIWIGSLLQGVYCKDKDGRSRSLTMENSELRTNSITCLYSDARSHLLYIGTSTGFYIYDTKSGTFPKRSKAMDSLSEIMVTSLYKDHQGLVWIGTRTGIIVYDAHGDRIYHINIQDGLSHPYVRSIIQDLRNRIWVSTDHGLTSIKVRRQPESKGYLFVCTPYYEEDGLIDATSSSNASCRTRRGKILLGNAKGFTSVRQDVDEPYYMPTNVVFTSMLGKDIVVDHDQNNITIEVSAMNYTRKHKIHYLYRLRGGQEEWTPMDGNRITFNALAPGHYTLEVKATDLGSWTSKVSTKKIIVRPPFWFSWPAFVLYFLLAGMAVWLYMKHLKQKHKEALAAKTMELELQQQHQMEENKMRFFTNISHDLKTPLTLIITPLEKLLGGSLDKNLRTELELVWRNAKFLKDGVSQLLDLRRLDAGSEELHLSHGDFIEFLRKIVDTFKHYSDNRAVTMSMKINAASLEMDFDQNKMRRVVMNLLSNAFKYNTPQGNVTVTVGIKSNDQPMMHLEIADTGIGIKDENKKRIFDRFYQEKTDGEYIGSGIGLHIVKVYVAMHHGEIYVEDNHPQGSVFVVNIPMRQSVIPSVDEHGGTEDIVAPLPVPASQTGKKVTILIVEDNQDFRAFLERCLNDQYHVLTAGNGIEALKVLDSNDVSIVISDIMMPEMNGLELCNRIKTDINYSHIPVIMLTAKSTEDNIITGLKDGADDYITKPFNLNILMLRIQKILEWKADNHRSFAKGIEIAPSEITVSSIDEQLIEKAIKIVEDKMGDTDFTVEEFSTSIGMTRGHLYKKLMAITGKSPIEFIRAIRIKRGRSLLEQGRTNISEVAYTVGFSPKQFSKFFREEYGCLPSEFIKK